MKRLIAVSLTLNLALAAWLVASARQRPASLTQFQSGPQGGPKGFLRLLPQDSLVKVLTNNSVVAFHWSQIELADYREYISKLRAIECPERVIRDMIIADVSKLYSRRFAALQPPRKYWEREPSFNRQLHKRLNALEREKEALLKQLLGEDFNWERECDNQTMCSDGWEEHLCFMPDERQGLARKVIAKLREQEEDLFTSPHEEDMERYFQTKQRLRKDFWVELAKVVTPAELEEFKLRTSQTAQNLRYSLATFKPTPDEFRAIFRISEEFQSTYPEGPKPKDYWRKMNDAIRSALGEQRYVDYERLTEHAYTSAMAIAARDGLPRGTGDKVLDMKKAAEQEAKQIRADKTITDDERRERLTAVKGETEAALVEVLGGKGFKTYRKEGGYWLKDLYWDNQQSLDVAKQAAWGNYWGYSLDRESFQ